MRNPHVRPPLSRSRSQTLPSNSTNLPDDGPESDSNTLRPPRPTQGRSNSYLSPTEPKPGLAQNLPSEKTSRIHLPGTSKHSGEDHHHRHRYTQSQSEAHHRSRASENDSLPHLVAGLTAEREKRHQLERLGTNASDLWHMRTNELKRITSPRTGQGNPRDGLRGRETSDPRTPLAPPTRKTSAEVLLDRAEARKMANRAALTGKDIERMKRDREVAETELRDRLSDIGNVSSDINRRLEYTYYNLLEKLGNLVGTIKSFQNLSTQSQHLIDNFEAETSKLDEDIQRRLERFRTGFDERGARVAELEERGATANLKAKELGTRLENARVIVENWERREATAKKIWGRFWGFLWWTFIIVSAAIVVVVIGKEWWFRGDPVAAGLRLPPEGSGNKSLGLAREDLRKIEVPPEVKEVLEGIERRRRTKKIWPDLPQVNEDSDERDKGADDERLRLLDEL